MFKSLNYVKKNCIPVILYLLFQNIIINAQVRYNAIHSGVVLFDQEMHEVNAHGACIIKEGNKYYLFGEYRTDTSNAYNGFSCYSSDDLMNWNFEKIVLPVQSEGLLGPQRIGERVKVMKCPQTGEYIMFMHSDNLGYKDPCIAYATCKTVNGVYQFQGPLLFENNPIRKWDMGTFQDFDGKGYLLIHHGIIYELTSDYKSAKRLVTSRNPGGESPAMFKNHGIYYWFSSQLTSWERNDNYYLTATSLEGPWIKRGFIAPKGTLTWNSQCSFVLPIINSTDTFYIYMGDRWSYPKQGSAATYVWQPISINKGEILLPEFYENWKLNLSDLKWDSVTYSHKSILRKIKSNAQSWNFEADRYISKNKGTTISFPFRGRQIAIKAFSDSSCGYAKIKITDKNQHEILHTIIDFYCKYSSSGIRFLSPVLPKGDYTLHIEIMGEYPVWSDKKKARFGSTDSFVKIEDVFMIQ